MKACSLLPAVTASEGFTMCWKKEFPDKFIYLLDTPRISGEAAVELYEKRIQKLVLAYQEFSGKILDEEKLRAYMEKAKASPKLNLQKGSLQHRNPGGEGKRDDPGGAGEQVCEYRF